ncbi:hypothetical protein AJ80_03198 [Polytolypa hystricis UAMH7299]|uniref:Uncharacterized protein n=1 Tax=Polytolypa hystricis (strain UAMH7299) TaxID=1447883 RepID=A0A2B7YK18_POLH7|nr:hypothetical protein AJ80_03198 [Polytolypa hystricis UAMH7299]
MVGNLTRGKWLLSFFVGICLLQLASALFKCCGGDIAAIKRDVGALNGPRSSWSTIIYHPSLPGNSASGSDTQKKPTPYDEPSSIINNPTILNLNPSSRPTIPTRRSVIPSINAISIELRRRIPSQIWRKATNPAAQEQQQQQQAEHPQTPLQAVPPALQDEAASSSDQKNTHDLITTPQLSTIHLSDTNMSPSQSNESDSQHALGLEPYNSPNSPQSTPHPPSQLSNLLPFLFSPLSANPHKAPNPHNSQRASDSGTPNDLSGSCLALITGVVFGILWF